MMAMSGSEFFLTIDGRCVTGAGRLEVVNPADGRIFAEAPAASPQQLGAAVEAARRSSPAWSARTPEDRKHLIRLLGATIARHLDSLKRLLTREQGKPLAEAEREIERAVAWCQESTTLDLPTVVHEDSPERYCVTHRVPIGVVGAIAPWNSPLSLAMWKVVPALLTGNTVVLKPSPFTPLTTLRVGELAQQVLPPGVLNVISGDDALGPQMTGHALIDKVSFTGSVTTGRKVMQSASSTLKRLTLELGGNDPAIVLPDADIEHIVPELFWAAFRNSGQVCIAAKRLFVHSDIYDAVAARLVTFASGVRMGDGAEEGVGLGPVQNRLQYERLRRLIEQTRAAGYRFLTGGRFHENRDGYFVPVTIVDNPPDDAAVVAEEVFGPILPLLKFNDLDEVVERANATAYGLGASLWTENEEAALAIANRLDCGTVWINEAMHVSPLVPFGGHRESGIGVENGVYGLLEYTNAKTLSLRRRRT